MWLNMEKDNMKISEDEFQTLHVQSFRYCLGRKTYAVSDCVSFLIKYWSLSRYQKLIQTEVYEAIQTGNAGMAMDVAQWNLILNLETNGG